MNWWPLDELWKFSDQAGSCSCLNSWSLGRCLFWPSCPKGTNVGGRAGMHSFTWDQVEAFQMTGTRTATLAMLPSLAQPVLTPLRPHSSFLQVIRMSQKGSHCPCSLLCVETDLKMISFFFWTYWLHFPHLYCPGCFSCACFPWPPGPYLRYQPALQSSGHIQCIAD